jgi:uncharacterized protein YbjQ (UPF0145 family)
MTGDDKMIICTMDRVPGAGIGSILGIAYGCYRVQGERTGKWHVEDGDRTWPWAEDPEHYESLFRMAERSLRENAKSLGAEAVIGVRAHTDRDHLERPGIFLIGTAVRFLGTPEVVIGQEAAPVPDNTDDMETTPPQGIVSIAFEGQRGQWAPLEAVEKACQTKPASEEGSCIMELANCLGISQDRALSLYRAGLRTVKDVASSNPPDLARICGLNPTQARILLESAKSALKVEEA